MKLFRSYAFHIFISAVFLILISGQTSWAAQPRRILILPFTVHSEKNISYLKDAVWDMLYSRLSLEDKTLVLDEATSQDILTDPGKTVTDDMAISGAKKAGADYVLLGSLSVAPDLVSTSARLIDVSSGSAKVTFDRSGKKQDDIILHIQALAHEIDTTVFGVQKTREDKIQKSTDAADNRMNPEKVWEMELGKEKEKPSPTTKPSP